MQANDRVHLGYDNLGVVLGRLLDGKTASRPAELVKDGDLFLLIERMLRLRELDTVRISKVKGHADEALVRAGAVRDLDRLGNNGADEAADFGRRRVPWWIIDARRNYSGVCARWRPVVLGLHRLFIAIPQGGVHLGVGSVSFVEVLILYGLWAGERLDLEKAVPGTVGQVAQFQCRLFLLVQALIYGDLAGTLGRCFYALVALPGGIRRVVPCDVGANHCRLGTLGGKGVAS